MIYIIGVNHDAQFYRNPRLSLDLYNYLLHTVKENKVTTILEEASKQDLIQSPIGKTIAQNLCMQVNLKHVFCEPDDKERRKQGIMTGEELLYLYAQEQLEIIKGTYTKEKRKNFEDKMKDNEIKREIFWFNFMRNKLDEKNIFICGAGHLSIHPSCRTGGFDKLLKRNGLNCKILKKKFY